MVGVVALIELLLLWKWWKFVLFSPLFEYMRVLFVSFASAYSQVPKDHGIGT
jgi:hypothetical protein